MTFQVSHLTLSLNRNLIVVYVKKPKLHSNLASISSFPHFRPLALVPRGAFPVLAMDRTERARGPQVPSGPPKRGPRRRCLPRPSPTRYFPLYNLHWASTAEILCEVRLPLPEVLECLKLA